eukprot:671800_1
MAAQQEGILDTQNDFSQWLHQWKLSKYEQPLTEQGIESQDDFKYIKSKEQFDALVKNLGTIPFMHVLKLQDAWHSIRPLKEQQQNTQIYFLGEDERRIMDKLHQRCNDISDDINTMQQANKDFIESVVESKRLLNEKIDQLIQALNQTREQSLHKMDSIKDKNVKFSDAKLKTLQSVSKICIYNKQQFAIIAASKDLSTDQRLSQLQELLTMNMTDDDEKQLHENYDHYKMIDHQCVYPGKMNIKFDQQTLDQAINSLTSVQCNNITKEWTIRQTYCPHKLKTFATDLISHQEEKQLLKWIDNVEERNVSLLYRASKDGFDLNIFHQKCDDKTPTLVIVKSEHNHIFGGYTEKSWKGDGNWVSDKNAWIYLLRSAKKDKAEKWKVKERNGSWATLAAPQYGPYFGNAFCFTKATSASYGGANYYLGPNDINALAGAKHYTVLDWEVWHIP